MAAMIRYQHQLYMECGNYTPPMSTTILYDLIAQ